MATKDFFKEAQTYKKSVDLLMSVVIKDCMEYLKMALKKNGGKISIHTYDEDGFRTDDNSFCVPYDGGNHPEYASNVFSDVESIYTENGDIYLETEDCKAYDLENIDIYTTYDLCEYIHDVILK